MPSKWTKPKKADVAPKAAKPKDAEPKDAEPKGDAPKPKGKGKKEAK
jgi:hypothetical protein